MANENDHLGRFRSLKDDYGRMRISRRGLMGVALGSTGLGALAATGVIKRDEAYKAIKGLVFSSSDKSLKTEAPINEEKMLHLWAIQTVLKDSINPDFLDQPRLNALTDRNNPELPRLLKGLESSDKYGSVWKVGLTIGTQTSQLGMVVDIKYGTIDNGAQIGVKEYEIDTNLLAPNVEKFRPFIDEGSQSLKADVQVLRDFATTFLKLPEGMNWSVMSRQDILPKPLGILGKYGDSNVTSATYQMRLTTDGQCEVNKFFPLVVA